jgi:hypothetical protein
MVQDYCTRFNNLYNAISTDIKPPQGLALIKFPDGFDADMSYQLRERNATTLEDMQKSAISVEANLLAKRARQRSERRVTIKEEPSTSTTDSRLDSLTRAVELLMERTSISDRNPPRDNTPALRFETPILEETLLKSGKEIQEIKGIREVLISRSGLPCKKTMLMTGGGK